MECSMKYKELTSKTNNSSVNKGWQCYTVMKPQVKM